MENKHLLIHQELAKIVGVYMDLIGGKNNSNKFNGRKMIKVYTFTCGTRITFTGNGGQYLIEEPEQTLTFTGLFKGEDWLFVRRNQTYKEWLEARHLLCDRGEYTNILFKIIVDNSEEEYKKGMRYKET